MQLKPPEDTPQPQNSQQEPSTTVLDKDWALKKFSGFLGTASGAVMGTNGTANEVPVAVDPSLSGGAKDASSPNLNLEPNVPLPEGATPSPSGLPPAVEGAWNQQAPVAAVPTETTASATVAATPDVITTPLNPDGSLATAPNPNMTVSPVNTETGSPPVVPPSGVLHPDGTRVDAAPSIQAAEAPNSQMVEAADPIPPAPDTTSMPDAQTSSSPVTSGEVQTIAPDTVNVAVPETSIPVNIVAQEPMNGSSPIEKTVAGVSIDSNTMTDENGNNSTKTESSPQISIDERVKTAIDQNEAIMNEKIRMAADIILHNTTKAVEIIALHLPDDLSSEKAA